MSAKRIYFFNENSAEGDPSRKDILGGKGASLAAMSHAGLHVPPGFTLSVECCRFYHDNNGVWPEGLEEELRENLARLEEGTGRRFGRGAKPLLVSVRSGAAVSMPGMMDTLLNCGLNPGLADELPDASRFWRVYAQFVRQFGSTVAGIADEAFEEVAASLAEDARDDRSLAEAYRALYEEKTGKTFPTTPWQSLVECINAVFGSWYNERAVTYRKAQDIRGVSGTAVNVQAMFPSEVSGIAFTANPADPFAHEVLIESSYGLGEAIVSGLVTPDLFVVDYETGEITERTPGKKAHAFASIETSSRAETADPSALSLTDEEVDRIARLALNVEALFGHPVDIEWGLAEGKLALLQARAIRGLEVARDIETGRQEEIERLGQLAADKRKVWVVHNLAETLSAPTPLTWDIARQFMSGNGGFGRMYQDFGYQPSERVCDDGFLELICGRVYVDPERAAELFWGNAPLEYDLEAVLEDPAVVETAPSKFNADRADGTFFLHLPRFLWAMLRASRTLKRARACSAERFDQDVLPPYLAYLDEKRKSDLTKLSTPQVTEELRERIDRIMGDFGKESLKPGFFGGLAMADLERILIRLMGQHEGRHLVGELTAGLEGDSTVEQNLMLYHVARGEASLDDFLARYGHRCVGEMELAEPRWREDSSYLERVMVAYRHPTTSSPEERHAANVEMRQTIERELPERLAEWGGSSMLEGVNDLTQEAQALLPYREIGKHYLMMGYELIREVILELSRRWELGRDVFFLHLDELERFESERDSLLGEIAKRRTRWQSAQRLAHPDLIDSDDLGSLGLPGTVEKAHEVEALALAPGVAEGAVRIIFSPTQTESLPEDCILVCPSTDPGWTALFTSIRGLVVERGGMLSHGAITARDFGIPAVACHDATRRFRDALRLRVDGNRGLITILDGNANA